MKLLACSVRDSVVGAFTNPMWFRSRGEAVRSFSDAVNDPKVEFGKHADHYSMYALAEFDDQSGAITGLATPELLINGLDCLPKG